jgi:DNA-binding Lrp family transcriptional regulator
MNKIALELNGTARKVLSRLEMRARDSFATIARDSKVSEQLVKYHIQKAKECGFISEFNAILDPSPLGYTLYILYFRFLGVSSLDERRWIERCTKVHGVYVASLMFGKWSGFLAVWARNQEILQSIISEVTHPVAGKIAEMQVTTRLHSHYTTTQILNPNKQIVLGTSSMSKKPMELDDKDVRILKSIGGAARKSVAVIGEEIGLSSTAVHARLQKLEDQKVIVAYRTTFRYEQLGLTHFRLFLRLVEPSASIIKRITNELFNTGYIFIVSRHLGFADLDARGYTKDLQHLSEMMAHIRDKFVDDIVQIDMVPFLSLRYVNHLPVDE